MTNETGPPDGTVLKNPSEEELAHFLGMVRVDAPNRTYDVAIVGAGYLWRSNGSFVPRLRLRSSSATAAASRPRRLWWRRALATAGQRFQGWSSLKVAACVVLGVAD